MSDCMGSSTTIIIYISVASATTGKQPVTTNRNPLEHQPWSKKVSGM